MRIIVIISVALVAFIGGFLGVVSTLPPPEVEPTEEAVPVVDVAVDSSLPDSVRAALGDSVLAEPIVLEDSLSAYREKLAAAQQAQAELEARIASMTASNEVQQNQTDEITALSATLPKLEPAELKAILAQLDMSVLELLYEQASARNRTSILQALSPDRAAAFVHRLVRVPKSNGAARSNSGERP